MTTTVNAFESLPGGEVAYKLTQTREQNAKPHVEKVIRQYERGLLSLQDMLLMLVEVHQDAIHAHGQAVANHVLGLVLRDYSTYMEAGIHPPKVYEPGFHAETWTIAWEEGPYEWAIDWSMRGYCLPGHVEAVNHWCLAIYPNA